MENTVEQTPVYISDLGTPRQGMFFFYYLAAAFKHKHSTQGGNYIKGNG